MSKQTKAIDALIDFNEISFIGIKAQNLVEFINGLNCLGSFRSDFHLNIYRTICFQRLMYKYIIIIL